MRYFYLRNKKAIHIAVVAVILGLFCFLTFKTITKKEIKTEDHIYAGSAFGTAIKKTIYTTNEGTADEADIKLDSMLKTLESTISYRITDTEVFFCNRNYAPGGIYQISSEILDYMDKELVIAKETKGAFSPCVRPLTDLWAIESGGTEVPEEADIKKAIKNCNYKNIDLTDTGIIFKEPDMGFDFGAVGKGIACDKAKKVLKDLDVNGAVISIGGSVLAYGDKGDGSLWHIGIQDPRAAEGETIGVVDVPSGYVVSTSGDYEKYFEYKGKRYHHIIDPKTGYPADNGLCSVTIVCEDGFTSDALSTACFVLGLEDGMKYAEKKGVGAIFVTTDKKVYVSKDMKSSFDLRNKKYKLGKKVSK